MQFIVEESVASMATLQNRGGHLEASLFSFVHLVNRMNGHRIALLYLRSSSGKILGFNTEKLKPTKITSLLRGFVKHLEW